MPALLPPSRPARPRLARFLATGALLVLAAAALPACLKLRTGTTILDDGSGKLVFRVSMKKDTFDALTALAKKEGGAEESEAAAMLDLDPDDLRQQFSGFVAFSAPERTTENGWVTSSVTAWFEDVNGIAVKSKADEEDGEDEEEGELKIREEKDETLRFSWKPEGAGFVLTATGGPLADVNELVDQLDPTGKSEEELAALKLSRSMLKGMMGGMEMEQTVTLPGPVTAATGVTAKSGRTATLAFALDELMDETKVATLAPKLREAVAAPFRITCGKPETTAEERAAFRKELAAAKADWEKRVALWDAEKAKQPKAPEPGTAPGNEPGSAPTTTPERK